MYIKYTIYAASIINPLIRFSRFFRIASTSSKKALATATPISKAKPCLQYTGVITALIPITASILNTLLPTILPIAISALPLIAANTEVNNSGSEVPSATMVRPMNFRSFRLHEQYILRNLRLFYFQ